MSPLNQPDDAYENRMQVLLCFPPAMGRHVHLFLLASLFSALAFCCSPPQPSVSAYCDLVSNSTWIIPGDLFVADSLNIGSSLVEVQGSLLIFPNATVFVTVDDAASGKLVVSGSAALGGTLNITFISRPMSGSSSVILVNASSGTKHSFQETSATLTFQDSECYRTEITQTSSGGNNDDETPTFSILSLDTTLSEVCPHDEHNKGAIVAASTVAGIFVTLAVLFWSVSVATRQR